MKHSIYLFLSLLVPVFITAQKWKIFSDTSIRFTAKYPDNWVLKIKENKRVFFTSPAADGADNFLENINIGVTENPAYGPQAKITDFIPAMKNRLKGTLDEFAEESSRFFKWNGQDAGELIYSGIGKNSQAIRARVIQWFCFYKYRLYVLTFSAKAGTGIHNITAGKIMKSIVFR